LYEDFAKGDVPAVLAVLDGDIRWFEAEGNPLWLGAPAIGPQQVVEQVSTRLMQDYDGFTITVNRIVGLGDTVVMEGRYSGSGKASGRDTGRATFAPRSRRGARKAGVGSGRPEQREALTA
jgi:hypothetical protein